MTLHPADNFLSLLLLLFGFHLQESVEEFENAICKAGSVKVP